MHIHARVPLPTGAFEAAHLGEARAVAFFTPTGFSAWSLVDGLRLWVVERPEPARFLGADARVAIVQELRRPDGRARWLEGIDVATGARLFSNPSTPEAVGPAHVIDGHAYAIAPKGSLKIELATGRVELTTARPWYPGPRGHYGIDGANLTRFDGRGVHRVGKIPKLPLLGVARRWAVLAKPEASARVLLMDVETTTLVELVLPTPMSAVVRGHHLVLAPFDGDAVAFDVDAIALASVEGAVALADVPVAWRLPSVLGVERILDGDALLAVGVGLVHTRDGRVLAPDAELDRAVGSDARFLAWSTRRGDTEAVLYGA